MAWADGSAGLAGVAAMAGAARAVRRTWAMQRSAFAEDFMRRNIVMEFRLRHARDVKNPEKQTVFC
jgi:hypothetical protein